MNFSNLGHRESENSTSNDNVIKKRQHLLIRIRYILKTKIRLGLVNSIIILILMHYASTIGVVVLLVK